MEFGKANKVVYGLFETRAALETAVGRLKAEGFLSSDISALLPTVEGSKEFAHEKETKAPEGAAAGAAGGAVLGGALGWLAGIGTLAIPGLGPFVAAGPILATLGGAGVGGALGGIAGALVGMGIPEYEAKRFESSVKEGGMLLSVHAGQGEWVEKAKAIFKECGAHDVSSTSEEKGEYKDKTDSLFGSKSKDTSSEKRY
ncbi:quinol:electron acceptor oxidoreductase subunit ActD [Pseudobdellovibrio sp. HCB154]|uniref:quinol:electron acceptor oxidoreductase subunit ActD n=1 Tax=Pseudobdellovibrio sp. HCB154 TaxID=3386277 RepID=UPI0039172D54